MTERPRIVFVVEKYSNTSSSIIAASPRIPCARTSIIGTHSRLDGPKYHLSIGSHLCRMIPGYCKIC